MFVGKTKALQEREAAGWYYVRSYEREREKGGGREMVRVTGVGVIDALSLSLSLSLTLVRSDSAASRK